MLAHQPLNRHQGLVSHIGILKRHQLHHPRLASQVRNRLLRLVPAVLDELTKIMSRNSKHQRVLAGIQELNQAPGSSAGPKLQRQQRDSLDGFAVRLLSDPRPILHPELLALVRGAPDQVPRLELAHILVIRRQVLQPSRELVLEELEVLYDLLVGPLPRQKGDYKREEFRGEHGGEVLSGRDSQQVLLIELGGASGMTVVTNP